MTSPLKESARRVQDFLTTRGFDVAVAELPGSTRTAQEAADSVGCQVGQIAKSLVFKNESTGEPVLVIASGINRVDWKKIAAATGLLWARADGKFVKETVGYTIGGVPPAGHDRPLTTFLDPDLLRFDTIWAAAGTPFAAFAAARPLEADPSGTVVGSSDTVATLRDWARFGLPYLQDGLWNGERVLPPGWVKYTTTPTPKAPKGQYGSLFWLNAPARPSRRLAWIASK